ncbi:hypothetical protein DM02DRAFT_681538 [Periconia macrospinosa]|uniref:Uncharacterized protein n=1 Tax=Periconia macrospinosa TaxID=97972 RepID=A0A2V1E6X3_9PLEO|nr:hypothetical protein DM02DRAFT_681538 [Periconia macrospinosa]
MPFLRNPSPTLSLLLSFKYDGSDNEEEKHAKDSSHPSTARDSTDSPLKVTWALLPTPPSSSEDITKTKNKGKKVKKDKSKKNAEKDEKKKKKKSSLPNFLTSFAQKLTRPFFPHHHHHHHPRPPTPPSSRPCSSSFSTPSSTPPTFSQPLTHTQTHTSLTSYTSCPPSCKCHDPERERRRGVVKTYPSSNRNRSLRLRDRDERGKEIVEKGKGGCGSWGKQEWGAGRAKWLMGLQEKEEEEEVGREGGRGGL